MNKSRILQAFVETPWAILPHKLEELREIVERHANGEKLDAAEIESRIHGASRPADRRVNSVAVLPLFGTIFPRANLMTQMSGATSAEIFGAQFDALIKDPEVGAIVLDVNSPGGSAYGIQEVSKKIFDARGQKPIVAVANHMAASAAYWMASAADELVITPSGDVGSIGVWSMHADFSAALDKEGIKVSLISAGKYKVEGNAYQPLGEEARAAIQASVDEVYDYFVEAVARNRGVNPAAVRNGFGEGRVVGAREALKLGMADRVGTLDETIRDLLGKNVPLVSAKASDTDIPKLAESGQAPASDKVHTQEARARLASVGHITLEGDNEMNQYVRTLVNQREALVARAQELVDTADKENRDMTEEERAEFNEIVGVGDEGGKVAALDAQIERIQGEREKLRTAAEKEFTVAGKGAEKPDAKGSGAMKRAEFNKLNPEDQAAYIKGKGKVED